MTLPPPPDPTPSDWKDEARRRCQKASARAMYACEECTDHNPEGCCYNASELRVMPDGRWICENCYDDGPVGSYGEPLPGDNDFRARWSSFSKIPDLYDDTKRALDEIDALKAELAQAKERVAERAKVVEFGNQICLDNLELRKRVEQVEARHAEDQKALRNDLQQSFEVYVGMLAEAQSALAAMQRERDEAEACVNDMFGRLNSTDRFSFSQGSAKAVMVRSRQRPKPEGGQT